MTEKTPARPAFDELSDDAIVRPGQLCPDVVPVARLTLRRWIREGKFPPPTHTAPKFVGWRVGLIRAWLRKPQAWRDSVSEQPEFNQ